MTTQQSTLDRLRQNPFGAAQDPAKPVRSFGAAPAATGGATSMPSTTITAPAPAVPRPTRTLGDTHTWTPSLNSGTDRTGAPVYDSTSIQRLQARNTGGSPARPDFSNVTTGGPAPAVPRPTRTLDPTRSASVPFETDYTRPAPPDPASPPIIARPSAAPQVQQSVRRTLDTQRDLTRTTRADAAEMLNPMSADAEILRRLENSQRSYFNKGSPQARRLIGEAIAGQLGARSAASAEGQRGGNITAQQGVGYEAAANEAAAQRRLDADKFTADAGYRERALATEAATRRAELERPSLQTDAAGNLLQVTGTKAAPITGEDGAPVRMPQRPVTARDHQAEADDKLLAELLGLQKDSYGEYPSNALETARRQLAEIRGGQRGGAVQVPEVGGTLDGYRFRGGDPSDPANWEAQ
ncbi:hypothetical protein FQY83_14205 [Luteimonas marina]|uniref:Uncharacterized protein n=1 Tax=Luteimonas marina TaxID=488485 RepID=A0A5C5TYP8_9GAMM|nr:hypothetical protein [Luteimonas marina]TWT18528.1 hypothetical protein FQY83_14205 [Luteimonas marina]